MLGGGVVPGIARCRLVMPDVFARIGVDRDDGGQEQVVALALAAPDRIPQRAVADTDVEQVQLRVVGEGVPGGSAAALLDERAAMPGLLGDLHSLAFGRLVRVAGDGEEAPGLFAGFGIVGGDVAAHAELGAAVADHDLAIHDPWRARDGVAAFLVVAGVDRPDAFTCLGVDGFEAAVEHADVDLTLPHGDATVDRIAAGFTCAGTVGLGVIFPDLLAGARIERIDDGEGAGGVHHAVHHDRRGFHAPIDVQLVTPGQAELVDVLVGDVLQWAVALLAVVATVAHPVAGFCVCIGDALTVHIGGVQRKGQ